MRFTCWTLLLVLLLAGCDASGLRFGADGGASVPADADAASSERYDADGDRFAAIQDDIFTPNCAMKCHGGGGAPESLRLDAPNAFASLINVPSRENSEILRVRPGDPENSYLYMKLVPADARRVGGRCPPGGPYLDATQIEAIRQWIANDAEP